MATNECDDTFQSLSDAEYIECFNFFLDGLDPENEIKRIELQLAMEPSA
jgi:hypothetical protein